MIRILLAAVAVCFIVTSPLQGQVYQWVDENGVKHFSNTPPPDGVNDVHTYEELKSESGAESSGASESQNAITAEGGNEAQVQSSESPPAQNPAAVEASGDGEEQEIAETEDAGELESSGEVVEDDEVEDTAASEPSDSEDRVDLELENDPENPAAGRSGTDVLIGQERDRLEIRMAQLNRQLEDALIARDSSSSNDAKRWNKRIQQLRAQIEKEKKRSEVRIEEIRSQSGL